MSKYNMESIEVITPPASTSVSTATLKAHLRLNDTSEDSLLSDWLSAADDLFARQTGFVLVSQTLRLRLDDWPSDGVIFVPRHPVTAVSSVQYLDTAGTWQTINSNDYAVDLGSVPARIAFVSGYSFPTLHATSVPRVRVQFVCGGTVPALVAVGVRLLASHWYNVREAFGEVDLSEVPAGWSAITSQFKTGCLGSFNEEVR